MLANQLKSAETCAQQSALAGACRVRRQLNPTLSRGGGAPCLLRPSRRAASKVHTTHDILCKVRDLHGDLYKEDKHPNDHKYAQRLCRATRDAGIPAHANCQARW